MFVRIKKGDVDAIYECSEARIVPQEDPSKLLMTIEQLGNPEGRSIIIDKACPEALGVYYMNAQGKTIDVVFRKGVDEKVLSEGDDIFIYDHKTSTWFETEIKQLDETRRHGKTAVTIHKLGQWNIPIDQIEWNEGKDRWEHYRLKCEE